MLFARKFFGMVSAVIRKIPCDARKNAVVDSAATLDVERVSTRPRRAELRRRAPSNDSATANSLRNIIKLCVHNAHDARRRSTAQETRQAQLQVQRTRACYEGRARAMLG